MTRSPERLAPWFQTYKMLLDEANGGSAMAKPTPKAPLSPSDLERNRIVLGNEAGAQLKAIEDARRRYFKAQDHGR